MGLKLHTAAQVFLSTDEAMEFIYEVLELSDLYAKYLIKKVNAKQVKIA